jgi:hypothetical protein
MSPRTGGARGTCRAVETRGAGEADWTGRACTDEWDDKNKVIRERATQRMSLVLAKALTSNACRAEGTLSARRAGGAGGADGASRTGWSCGTLAASGADGTLETCPSGRVAEKAVTSVEILLLQNKSQFSKSVKT